MLSPVQAETSPSPFETGATRNLVLVHQKGRQDLADFIRIRELIHERAPDIEAFIADADHPCSVTRRKASRRPSLAFAASPPKVFRPRGGRVYFPRRFSKIEKMQRLHAAGIATPETVHFTDATTLDPESWGPLTLIKPDYGWGGNDITVVRTHEVSAVRQSFWPAGDRRHRMRMLAQKFIDTGTYPSKYRMLVLFGRVLYCEQQAAPVPAPKVDPFDSGPIEDMTTSAPLSDETGLVRKIAASFDVDVLALAPQIAAAFPEAAVLGIDLVREAATGRLYVLETNPNGYTWHLSSNLGKSVQQRVGIDRYAQFDALSVAADVLIERTRAEAEW
jgi:hypothetical protein